MQVSLDEKINFSLRWWRYAGLPRWKKYLSPMVTICRFAYVKKSIFLSDSRNMQVCLGEKINLSLLWWPYAGLPRWKNQFLSPIGEDMQVCLGGKIISVSLPLWAKNMWLYLLLADDPRIYKAELTTGRRYTVFLRFPHIRRLLSSTIKQKQTTMKNITQMVYLLLVLILVVTIYMLTRGGMSKPRYAWFLYLWA